MEEIKEGEYVRTSEGYIGKYIKDALAKGVIIVEDNEMAFTTGKHNISKHSPDIIDLIEEGDYVNGKKIISTYLDGARHYIKYEYYDGTRIYNEDIKSIVTKEMFNQVKYEV